MKTTIWKFTASDPGEKTVIFIPQDHKILSVGIQGQQIVFWAEVDPDSPKVDETYLVIGTGWIIPENGIYIGTVQYGILVWHLYKL
jgi:hypothetical protein